MNVFSHEFTTYFKTTLIWALCLSAAVGMYMLLFQGISNDAQAFMKIIDAYPPAVKQARGLSIETFASLLGFYTFTLTFILLAGAIQAMSLGISLLSKEITDKTADFLLTKPISRFAIISEKILAALSLLLISNGIFIVVSYAVLNLVTVEHFAIKLFFMTAVTLLFIQLIFMALGILISVIIPKIKSVIAISLSGSFAFFIIGTMVNGPNDWLRFLTPFKYFDFKDILAHQRYEPQYIVMGVLVVIVSIAVSYVLYIKKDIQAV